MRSRWLRPEPFSSTSTISMPAGAAACSAMAVIFEMVSSRFIFVSSKANANKKVGFRPLSKFDRQLQYNKETEPASGYEAGSDSGCSGSMYKLLCPAPIAFRRAVGATRQFPKQLGCLSDVPFVNT